MTGQELFFTAQEANEGRRMPLVTPDGKPTEHWLLVRNVDSLAFRVADTESKRNAAKAAEIKDVTAQVEYMANEMTVLISSLVADWSFAQPCTRDSVVTFLKQAPQIEDAINRFAARGTFFRSGQPNSANGIAKG